MDQIPWLIKSDLDVLCLVHQNGDGSTKKELMTLADIICWITKTRGVTEATMLDHDLQPLMQAGPVNMNLVIIVTTSKKQGGKPLA